MSLLAQLEFAAPMRLMVLAFIPAVLLLSARRGRTASIRWLSAGLRCLVLALLAAAWANPQWLTQVSEPLFVVLNDVSESVARTAVSPADAIAGQLREKHGKHMVVEIKFAGTPSSPYAPSSEDHSDLQTDETNLGEALLLAQATVRANQSGHIVLASDGLQTRSNLVAAISPLSHPISIAAFEDSPTKDAAVLSIDLPRSVPRHQPVSGQVVVMSRTGDEGRIEVSRDGQFILERTVQLSPGRNVIPFTTRAPQNAVSSFQARVVLAGDVMPENDFLVVQMHRGPPAKVWLVDDNADLELRRLLVHSEFEVSDRLTDDTRLIVLSGVASDDLDSATTEKLDRLVRENGLGLLVLGGDATFGEEALQLTALEKLLPVVAVTEPEQKQRSLAMVLVIDKSKSMLEERRLELAKEAAKQVANELTENDQVGVLAFGDETEWVSELSPLTNKADLLRRIDSLTAVGLTNMYPAMLRAYLALQQTEADARHVILLTDGVPTPGDFTQLARQMAAADISVSTVSLSAGADQTILKDIAANAQGKHLHADDPAQLPQILVRETQTAVAKTSGEQFSPRQATRLPGLIIEDMPPLNSYVTTQAKDDARTVLEIGDGDPFLTLRRHGRGVVAAITADLTSDPKQSWPGRYEFWRRLATHLSKHESPSSSHLHLVQHGEEVIATYDLVNADEQSDLSYADVESAPAMLIAEQDKDVQTIASRQTAPGRFEASWPLRHSTDYRVTVSSELPDVNLSTPIASSVEHYADEYAPANPNRLLLTAVADTTGGKVDAEPEDITVPDGGGATTRLDLWQWPLVAALVVFLFDVFVYRRPRVRSVAEADLARRAA